MTRYSKDTHPEIEKKQIELLKQKSIPEKLSQVQSISSLSIGLSKRAISRKNPGMNIKNLNFLFVKFHYGDKLYKKLIKYLENL